MPCRHASVSRAHRPTYNYSKARVHPLRAIMHARDGGRERAIKRSCSLRSPTPA